MADIQQSLTELDAMTRSGQILEALDKFYAENCQFQEGNQAPRVGRATQKAHLEGFFQTLKAFHGATLHSNAVDGDVSLSEYTFSMEGPDGPLLWNEVLRRLWRDGKVVSERYYQAA